MNKTRDHVRNYLLLGGISYYFYNFTLTNLFYKNSVLNVVSSERTYLPTNYLRCLISPFRVVLKLSKSNDRSLISTFCFPLVSCSTK